MKAAARARHFKSYKLGYMHIDVKYLSQMQDESGSRYGAV